MSLRTEETEVSVQAPASPNVRVGRVFDRNWELLSPILPVWAIRSIVHRHFSRTIPRAIEQNVSRLSSQWEESINAALWQVEKEASRRLDTLVATIERMIDSASADRIAEVGADLERIAAARRSLIR